MSPRTPFPAPAVLWRLCAGALAAMALLGAIPCAAQTSPSAYTTGLRYDLMGRVVGTISPSASGVATPFMAVRRTYDAAGRLTLLEEGSLSAWQSQSVAPSAWTGFTVFSQVATTYDELNRKLSDTVSSGGVTYGLTQYSYDPVGRPQCTAVRVNTADFAVEPASACTQDPITNPNADPSTTGDRITKNLYDADGQLIQVRKAVGTSQEQAYETYSYTPNGKPLDMVDSNGNHAQTTWDGFDRQATWVFPSPTAPTAFNPATAATALSSAGSLNANDYEQYGYDANGNRTSLRKRDGRSFGYTYDALNRVTIKTVPTACVSGYACTAAPASAVRSVYYAYDAWGRMLSARFDSTTGGDGVFETYDGFGRQLSTETSMGGTAWTATFAYDADDNRTGATWPDGQSMTDRFDGLNRLSALLENGSTQAASFTYDAKGELLNDTRAGEATSYGYDAISRPTSLGYDLSGTAADLTLGLTHNAAGQISGRSISNPAYIPLITNTSQAYVPNGLNQYVSLNGTAYAYDANGDLTFDGVVTYGYDAENRLISTSPGAALVYDALGRLYQTTAPSTGAVTRFLYDGDRLIAEYDGSGNLLRRYAHAVGADEPILWYEGAAAFSAANRRSLQADWQGSIVSVADGGGNSLIINAYDEYGVPNTANLGRFQFTGQAWLPEVGVYYYKARMYSPTLGRFLQTDPVGYSDNADLYAYVGDDPINGVDPSGTCTGSRIQNSDGTCKNGGDTDDLGGDLQGHQRQEAATKAGAAVGALAGGYLGATVGGTAGAVGGATAGAACGPAAVVCSPVAATAGGAEGAVTGGAAGATVGAVVGGAAGNAVGAVENEIIVTARRVHANSGSSMQGTELYFLINRESGAIDKIGVTSYPGKRYSDTYLKANNVYYFTQYKFEYRYAAYVAENIELMTYFAANGRFPPLNCCGR